MSKSIMQENKECYITGSISGLHRHHVMHGPHRRKAEKWGCWCYLRWDWHNGASYGVHHNHAQDVRLKQDCQSRFEQLYGHEKWMEVFGRNYL